MNESTPPIKRALILSGGGGRGAYQVGVWRRLQEIGWQPDLVCGTSIGSLNGALIGSGCDADQLEAFWKSLDRKQAFRVSLWQRIKYRIDRLLGRNPDFTALLDNEPLRQTLLAAVDVQRLRDNQPRVTLAATNVCRARLEYFSGEQLSVEHILASCAIPVVFPWSEIDGELYWDGGVMANTPVFPALEAGATEILVVLLAPLTGALVAPPKTTRAAFSWAFDMITIGSAGSLLRELANNLGLDLASSREKLTSQQFMDLGAVRVGVVAPQTAWGIESVLDLNPQRIEERIRAGYDDAAKQLVGFLQQPRE